MRGIIRFHNNRSYNHWYNGTFEGSMSSYYLCWYLKATISICALKTIYDHEIPTFEGECQVHIKINQCISTTSGDHAYRVVRSHVASFSRSSWEATNCNRCEAVSYLRT